MKFLGQGGLRGIPETKAIFKLLWVKKCFKWYLLNMIQAPQAIACQKHIDS